MSHLSTMDKGEFCDISQMILGPGDRVVFDERVKGHRHMYQVLEVERPNPDKPTERWYFVEVLDSTDKAVEIGTKTKMAINTQYEIWGAVWRSDQPAERMSEKDLQEHAVIQLRRFLDGKPDMKVKFTEALGFLLQLNILHAKDGDARQTKNGKWLYALCKQHPQLIESKGGWVFSTGKRVHFGQHMHHVGGKDLITVDFDQFCLGWRHLLQSISIIRLKNAD